MSSKERIGRRVVASHAIARSAFGTAAGFGVAAVVWAVQVLWHGGSWWGPLHAFVAGTILLAISGASQMFTITWAAAPPPPARLADGQRWTVATGVVLVLIGVPVTLVWAVVVGAGLVVIGLGLLAYSLWSSVQNSLLRRFDLSARFYFLALAAGIIGVVLGGIMGVGGVGSAHGSVRLVHSHINLVGLVGLTIVGTLPTILPTFVHHKAVSGQEARVAWWIAGTSVMSIVAGLFLGRPFVGAGTILAGVSMLTILVGILVRFGRKGLSGGLPYLQVASGSIWLGLWTFVDGGSLLAGTAPTHFSTWTAVAVVAGLAQVLLGSLAYLLPVLAGRPPLLGRNLKRTHARPWLPLALANIAGVALALGLGPLAAILVALWVLDFGFRVLRLEWGTAQSQSAA